MKPPFDIAADLDTPVSAYLKLGPFGPRFLLESVEGGERLARYSFLGFGDCLDVRLDAAGLQVGAFPSARPGPPPPGWGWAASVRRVPGRATGGWRLCFRHGPGRRSRCRWCRRCRCSAA